MSKNKKASSHSYGIISQDLSRILLNDGGTIRINKKDSLVSLAPGERVYFCHKDNNFFKCNTEIKRGEIVYLTDNTGYIHSTIDNENGEIFIFNLLDYDKPFCPYETVEFTPKSARKDDIFAYADNITRVTLLPLNRDVCNRIFEILCPVFKEKSEIPVYEAEKILQTNNIHYKDFGFSNVFLFYESLYEFFTIKNINGKNCLTLSDFSSVEEKYNIGLKIMKSAGYNTPTTMQEIAMRDEKFWTNNKILITGVTSSGKTALPIIRYLSEHIAAPKRMIYAITIRALAYQMKQRLETHYKDYNLKIAISTSEVKEYDQDIIDGEVDIAIIIYEKLFYFNAQYPKFLKNYDYVVFDEVGIIENPERGIKSSFLLSSILKIPSINTIILGTPYYNWNKYIQQYELYCISSHIRPNRINEFFFTEENNKNNQSFVFRNQNGTILNIDQLRSEDQTEIICKLCLNEYLKGHKVIVFSYSIRNSERLVREINKYMRKQLPNTFPACTEENIKEIKDFILSEGNITSLELMPHFNTDDFFNAFNAGITLHNASLPGKLRIFIEDLFLNNINQNLWLVVSTDTIAYGLNSNVDTIIISNMIKNNNHTMAEAAIISINDYQNCIGRSGRIGYSGVNYGTSYTFLPPGVDSDSIIDQYHKFSNKSNKPALQSKFSEFFTLNSEDLSFYLLGTMNNANRYYSRKVLISTIKKLLFDSAFSVDESLIINTLDNIIDELLSEGLIIQKQPDPLEEDSTDEYIISEIGKGLRGYIIKVSTFDILKSAAEKYFSKDDFFIFDFLFAISETEEVQRYCNRVYSNKLKDSNGVKKLFAFLLPVLVKHKYITNATIQLINIIIAVNDPKGMKRLKIALGAQMLIMGYCENSINNIAGYSFDSNNRFKNIRRTYGEKICYLIEIANNYLFYASVIEKKQHDKLDKLYCSLFFNIDFRMMGGFELTNSFYRKTDEYHIASIYNNALSLCETTSEKDAYYSEIHQLSDSVQEYIRKDYCYE